MSTIVVVALLLLGVIIPLLWLVYGPLEGGE